MLLQYFFFIELRVSDVVSVTEHFPIKSDPYWNTLDERFPDNNIRGKALVSDNIGVKGLFPDKTRVKASSPDIARVKASRVKAFPANIRVKAFPNTIRVKA